MIETLRDVREIQLTGSCTIRAGRKVVEQSLTQATLLLADNILALLLEVAVST